MVQKYYFFLIYTNYKRKKCNFSHFSVIPLFQRSLLPGCRALCAAELRYLSASGRYMHLRCVSCGKAALFGYFMLSPEGHSVDNSYLTFARTITRRARVRQLTIDSLVIFTLMIPYTKKRLFACWNNLLTIVSAARRQFAFSNCIRTA